MSALLIIMLIFALAGCGGGSDGPSSGRFLDSAVAGLRYETETHSGITDADGRFYYDDGQTVTFSIGDLVIGEAVGDIILTPVDLVPGAVDETHPTVINIARLLQSLDADDTLDNDIAIPEAAHAEVVGLNIRLDQPAEAFGSDPDVIAYFDALNDGGAFAGCGAYRTLLSRDATQAHLRQTLAGINGEAPSEPGEGGDADSDGGSGHGGGG